MMRFALLQKIVCLENRSNRVRVAFPEVAAVMVLSTPGDLRVSGAPQCTPDGWVLELVAGPRRTGYLPLVLAAVQDGARVTLEVPTRIFAEKECFFCLTTTTNFHWGFAPDRMQMADAMSAPKWDDVIMGDPLSFHGHDYAASRHMAEGGHRFNLPMTWLMDGTTAQVGAAEIARWHQTYGDDVGVLPPSYFFKNPVNYNTTKTQAETTAVLGHTRDRVEAAFAGQGWHFRPTVYGIDQWVGGVGTQWLAAGRALGFRGIWGTAFDHETCDGSMYSEGCPWDIYRTRPDNFRYPDTAAGSLWGLQWTTRELVNSFLEYPNSSTRYSTDPDDIKACGIMDAQADYWDRLLAGMLANLATCDFQCFLLHNEDHDAHRAWSQEYLAGFFSRLPAAVVPATLEEVTQWLDLRFRNGEHPRQLLELSDPLTCHDAVAASLGANPWIKDYAPPAHWKSVDGHNPSVLCYYDATCRWFAVQGDRIPRQYIDYAAANTFTETGTSPKARLPQIGNWREEQRTEEGKRILRVTFMADCAFSRLPLIWWDEPEIPAALATARCRVLLRDVTPGENRIEVALQAASLGSIARA